LDFSLNGTVEFTHNYTAIAYDNAIKSDSPGIGLNIQGGETKLMNIYESILNKLIEPTVIKLRADSECFKQSLTEFFRKQEYPFDSKVIYVLAETLPLINKFYPFQELLPYYSKIKFTLQPTGPIGTAIQQTRNDGLVMRHLQEYAGIELTNANGNRVFKESVGKGKKKKKPLSYLVEEDNGIVKTWNFYEWMLKLGERLKTIDSSQYAVDAIPQDSIIINIETKTGLATAGFSTPNSRYGLSLSAVHSKVAEIVKANARAYPELIRGDKPHKEAIAYKVVKYSNVLANRNSFGFADPININEVLETGVYDALYGDTGILKGNPTPVQEIWFFNSSKEEIIEYVDTQVKNDTFYTYVVYAYLIVLDSEYFYTNVSNPKVQCDEDNVFDFLATGETLPGPGQTNDPGFENTPIPVPPFPIVDPPPTSGTEDTLLPVERAVIQTGPSGPPEFGNQGNEPGPILR